MQSPTLRPHATWLHCQGRKAGDLPISAQCPTHIAFLRHGLHWGEWTVEECNAWPVHLLVGHASASAGPLHTSRSPERALGLDTVLQSADSSKQRNFEILRLRHQTRENLRVTSQNSVVAGNKVGAREQPLPRCLEPAYLGKEWLTSTIHVFC